MVQDKKWITNELFTPNLLNTCFLILCVIFLFSRIIYLDSDLPPWAWDVWNYNQMDELYYTTTAFNLYHYHNPIAQILPYVPTDSYVTNIFGTLLCFLTLLIFGNDYFGLRMCVVITALMIFIFMFFIFKNYIHNTSNSEYGISTDYSNILILFGLLYLLFDFSFLLAGRVFEQTIFRIFGLIIILFVFSNFSLEKSIASRTFVCFAGFLSVATVLYIYPENAFIIPAVFCTCVYAGLRQGIKNAVFQIIYFFIGAGICVVSFEFCLQEFFHQSIVDFFTYLSLHSDRIALSPESGTLSIVTLISPYVHNVFNIISTNIFRFNPILLVLFLCTLPVFLFLLITKKDLRIFALATLFGFYCLQSFFINDFFYKKPVIMLPMVLLIILISGNNYNQFFKFISEQKYIKVFYAYILLCICCATGILLWNNIPSRINFNYAALSDDIFFILLILFVLQLLLIGFAIRRKKPSTILCIIMVFMIMAPSIYLETKYVYSNPAYHFRDTMKTISEFTNGEILVGGWSYAFRLYSTSIPVLNIYQYKYSQDGMEKGGERYRMLRDRIISENLSHYTILFNEEDVSSKTMKIQYSSVERNNETYPRRLNLIYNFDLNSIEYGEHIHLGLYRYE